MGNNGTGLKPVTMQVPIANLHKAVCVCGGKRFVELFEIRVANRFQSPSGSALLVKTPTGFLCSDCGLANNYGKETTKQMGMFSVKGGSPDVVDTKKEGEE